jgi:hypothetical protein
MSVAERMFMPETLMVIYNTGFRDEEEDEHNNNT